MISKPANISFVSAKSFFLNLLLLVVFCLAGSSFAKAQTGTNEQLAVQYFQEKQYDKAAELFENIYNAKPSPFIYDYYFKCLIELKDFKKAEKFISKNIKKQPYDLAFNVDLGYIYLLEQEDDKSKKQFESTIKLLTDDKDQICNLANAFLLRNQVDYAMKTYEHGKKLMRNQYNFNLEQASIYLKQNDFQSALNQYLDYVSSYPDQIDFVDSKLQDLIQDDADNSKNDLFKNTLLQRIKKEPEVKPYAVMLLWYFIQEKEFGSAAVQAKALDKRFDEDGSRVITLARIAASNAYYDEAIDCYDYIITKKGEFSIYFNDAQVEKINTKFQKIINAPEPDKKEILALEDEYKQLLSKQNENDYALQLIKNLAHLQAFYLDSTNEASNLLEKALQYKNVSAEKLAQCKLELGDILLFSGSPWDASLLYMQVDKAYKNDVIGFEAKFRNAKLYYYVCEFDYAKAELDILKAATSKFIANDAMDLSLFLSDNMDEDSTYTGLKMFAHADLLQFRNKDEEALLMLDSIKHIGLDHPLLDDVLYKEAQIKIKHHLFAEADSLLSKLVNQYGDGIMADDALFLLGTINEKYLNNPDRAREMYHKLLTDYSGSTFAVEARSRFRNLRGDKIN